MDDWLNRPWTVKFENGESFAEVYDRASKALFEIVEKNKGQTIAVASHGGVLRALSCKVIYDDLTRLKEVNWFENTSVTVFEFDDDLNPTVTLFNDFSHLPNEYINDKSRISNFMEKKE
jgi:broad specificity phosphatase PhoE